MTAAPLASDPGASALPVPGALATTFAAAVGLLLAAILLGAGPGWRDGVVGGGDAWQTVWNFDHVERALAGEEPLWFSDRVWAPEGASLRAHTLAPALSLPGALLARGVGLPASYDLLVLASFALAAGATFRLGRRLGMSPLAAALAGLVLAFAPARFARTWGHLNLLALGFVPLALEGLLVAARGRGVRAWGGAALAAGSLVALALSDWYLAVLGALAATSFALFELVRTHGRRAPLVGRLAVVAVTALAVLAPVARPLAAEAAEASPGHDPSLCCTAVTSLLVPNRAQWISRWTRPLTERNTQNVAEGAAYLGLVPLAALVWLLARPRRRPRDLDWALAAGMAALVLALGPAPRVFDHHIPVALPYGWLERIVPGLALGGCVSRFVQLALLPLALAVGWAADRLLALGTRGRVVGLMAVAVLALEYAPVAPGVQPWPHDPAMTAIATAPGAGTVADLDLGVGALVRQLEHRRPQTFGYLSRTPTAQWRRRVADPVLGPLLGTRPVESAPPLPVAAAWLRHRWEVRWLVAPTASEAGGRAEALGLAVAERGARSEVLPVPTLPLAPVGRVDLGEPEAPLARAGVVLEGLYAPETVGVADRTVRGRWTGPEARLLVPVRPGRVILTVAAPRPGAPRLGVSWAGARRELEVAGVVEVALEVPAAALGTDHAVLIELHAEPFHPEHDSRELGVFLVTLVSEPLLPGT